MGRVCRKIFCFILFLFLAGCDAFTIVPYAERQISTAVSCDTAKIDSIFSYVKSRPQTIRWDKFPKETENYLIYNVQLIYDEPIDIRYYKSKRPNVAKAIIVLPLYGKHEYAASMFADYASWLNPEADIDVLYIQERPNEDPLDIDLLENISAENEIISLINDSARKFKAAVVGVRRIIDWAREEYKSGAPRIGIIGISTSSIVANLAAAADPRISATAIILGGGNLHEMVAFSKESRTKKGRERLLSQSGKTQKEFSELIKPLFSEVEPIAYARCINPSRILYVDSEFDEFIPKSGRDGLWLALQKPKRVTFHYGHRTTFLSLSPAWLFSLDEMVLKFFREKL